MIKNSSETTITTMEMSYSKLFKVPLLLLLMLAISPSVAKKQNTRLQLVNNLKKKWFFYAPISLGMKKITFAEYRSNSKLRATFRIEQDEIANEDIKKELKKRCSSFYSMQKAKYSQKRKKNIVTIESKKDGCKIKTPSYTHEILTINIKQKKFQNLAVASYPSKFRNNKELKRLIASIQYE